MLLKWFHERKEKNERIKDLLLSKINPLKYHLKDIQPGVRLEEWPNGNYTALYANFTFERRLSSHLFNFYIPSGLVVIISFLSFWFSVKSVSARLTVGLTTLLTLSTLSWQAHNGLPSISYLTALDVWLFSCMIQVFLTLIVYTMAYHRFRIRESIKKNSFIQYKAWTSSKWSQVIDEHSAIASKKEGIKKEPSKKASSVKALGQENKYETEVDIVDKVSRFLFPFCFTIFAISYWLYYLIQV